MVFLSILIKYQRQHLYFLHLILLFFTHHKSWLLFIRIKYSISIVADKGLKKSLYTSARLKKGEVLYLETHSCRYIFCMADPVHHK